MNTLKFDVAIIGSGPAGLQAAIHAARKKVSVLVLGREKRSSVYGAHLENYCCIAGVKGDELLREGRRQARGSGAEFLDEDVTEVKRKNGTFEIHLEGGALVEAKALVLAMGISRKKLRIPGEKEFLGRGVSYCVECDANFFKGEVVAVIGGKSAAVSGALTLLFYARDVHLVCDHLEVSDALERQLLESAVKMHLKRRVVEIIGDANVGGIVLDDGSRLDVTGVFIELGAKGAVEIAASLGVNLDNETMQYIAVNKEQETNVSGVFAAGDICGPPWQVAKAVGEGCVAGLKAASYVRELE